MQENNDRDTSDQKKNITVLHREFPDPVIQCHPAVKPRYDRYTSD